MSEKKKGLFNRMFSPDSDNNDEEPSPEQVRRWLNEPDGRAGYRPRPSYPSGTSSPPTGGAGQQQAFRDLAAGFGRQPGRFDPAPYTPPQPDQWNPRAPSKGGSVPPQPSGGGYVPPQPSGGGYVPPQPSGGGYVPPQPGGGWTPPQRWTPPEPGGWAPQQFADDDEGGGVEVGDVGPGGPLADAGVRAGDVIVAVDGTEVDDEQDLFDALGSLMPGRSATLEIIRGDSRMTTVVVAPR